jgi:hypothetical protein
MRIAAVDAVLTLHGIEAGTFAFIAFVPAGRAPAIRRGTAPPGQPCRHPVDAVLTLHGIEAGTFAFIAFVPAGRAPAIRRGTAPPRQPRGRSAAMKMKAASRWGPGSAAEASG